MAYFWLALPMVLQVLLIVHVFKTGADRFWIYILIFLPYAGGIAYLLLVVLPELFSSRAANDAADSLTKMVNPTKKLKELEARYKLSATVENRINLAQEYMASRRFDEGIAHLKEALAGLYHDDLNILSLLANAYFAASKPGEACEVFEQIRTLNRGEFKKSSDALRYAKTLELLQQEGESEEAYRKAAAKHPSSEILFETAEFYYRRQRWKEAHELYDRLVSNSRVLPEFTRRNDRQWISASQKRLKELQGQTVS